MPGGEAGEPECEPADDGRARGDNTEGDQRGDHEDDHRGDGESE